MKIRPDVTQIFEENDVKSEHTRTSFGMIETQSQMDEHFSSVTWVSQRYFSFILLYKFPNRITDYVSFNSVIPKK